MKWLGVLTGIFLSFCLNAEEKINSFHSAIEIGADGTLTVIETIDINVEGQQIKRGILRDFPTDYRDRLGRSVTVPFEPVSVKRDGGSEPFSSSRQANGVSLRIGSANVMLPLGRHVYEITYRTRWQLGFFESHDELYWNVNGNGWTFPMDQVSADVTLPKAVPAGELKAEAYTGPFGARGRDYAAETGEWGARFRSTRRLGVGEGLTIVFMFPKGLVAPPTFRQKFDRWLKDNRGEAFGLAGLLVYLAFLYWRWAWVGRDPRAGPLFPRYEAPRGVGPAGVRYLDKMACDDRCFASSLLGLGQRGFLKMTESGGIYRIRPTGAKVEWLPGDAPIAGMVGKGVDIGGKYDPVVGQARAALDADLKAHFDEKLFSLNRGAIALAVLIGGATHRGDALAERGLADDLRRRPHHARRAGVRVETAARLHGRGPPAGRRNRRPAPVPLRRRGRRPRAAEAPAAHQGGIRQIPPLRGRARGGAHLGRRVRESTGRLRARRRDRELLRLERSRSELQQLGLHELDRRHGPHHQRRLHAALEQLGRLGFRRRRWWRRLVGRRGRRRRRQRLVRRPRLRPR
jgi:hypothetical protein